MVKILKTAAKVIREENKLLDIQCISNDESRSKLVKREDGTEKVLFKGSQEECEDKRDEVVLAAGIMASLPLKSDLCHNVAQTVKGQTSPEVVETILSTAVSQILGHN